VNILFMTAIETARLTNTRVITADGEADPKDYPVNEQAREAAIRYCEFEGIKISSG